MIDIKTPSMKIFPLSNGSTPAITLNNVDFPHPDGPTITTNVPSCIEKDTSFNTKFFLS